MVNIKPVIRLLTQKSSFGVSKFIEHPGVIKIKPESLKKVSYAGDKLCLSTKKREISLEEVK